MTIPELYSELKQNGFADSEIDLHGLHGSTDDSEKLALAIKKGTYSSIYEVYYKERGRNIPYENLQMNLMLVNTTPRK